MIISHRHRFIFFKVAKTAGTSLEIALSRFCGPDDVITPLNGRDEKIRAQLGFRGPQNFVLPPIRTGEPKRKFFGHISAAKAKPMIDPWVWDNYYKFCFVRNPWDRVISGYWWYYRQRPSRTIDRPCLSEFITSNKAQVLNGEGLKIYTIDGAVVVDDVYRYEDLPGALDRIRQKLTLPDRFVLPNAKTHVRKDRRPYWDVLSQEDAEAIACMFADEIRLHGYTFREERPARPARQEEWVTPVISQLTRPSS